MKLPASKQVYNQTDDQSARSLIEQADAENHKRNSDVEISPGRLIIKSPNGTRWSIVVSDLGVISASSL